MMDRCEIVQDLIPLYIDKQASASSCALIEKHAADCKTCKALLAQMSAPLEQEPTDEIWLYQKALDKTKRRRRIFAAIVCLLLVVCWWLYMETHYMKTEMKLVSTDGKQISAEMPSLPLTEGELALADVIFTLPQLQDPNTTWQSVSEELINYFPSDANVLSVIPDDDIIEFCYFVDSNRVTVTYFDAHKDGTTDIIYKSASVFTDEPGRTLYLLEYDCKLKLASYEKREPRHVWFGFLSMDW